VRLRHPAPQTAGYLLNRRSEPDRAMKLVAASVSDIGGPLMLLWRHQGSADAVAVVS